MKNLLIPEKAITSSNTEEWKGAMESQPNEYDYWIDDIEGKIPLELQGTFFRNGPGLLDVHGVSVKHPFDGDGMICAFTFINGRCHFRNKFVRTKGYVKEQKAGKILYRGGFGTAPPGGWLKNIFNFKLKNVANTNVIYWGGKLLALWEAGKPYRLDPTSLETIGEDNLGGILKSFDVFGAHPKIDINNNCLVNFSIKPGLFTTITIYEFNLEGKLLQSYSHKIPGYYSFIHDFAITPNYCIFFQKPAAVNYLPYLLGFRGIAECFHFQENEPNNIIVIPRNSHTSSILRNNGQYNQRKCQTLKINSGLVAHNINAFQKGEYLYVDSICYESFPYLPLINYQKDLKQGSPATILRFKLNLKEETVEKIIIENRGCEFAAFNPDNVGKNYTYLFTATNHDVDSSQFLQAFLKLNLITGKKQLYSFAPHGYVNEPIFVPKPQPKTEDDGWLISLIYNGSYHRTDLVILDGLDLNRGPLARLSLKHHIPQEIHGSWSSECFLEQDIGNHMLKA